MATIIENPISPMSEHAYQSTHETSKRMDMTHLSGATMADLIVEPNMKLITTSTSASKRSSVRNLSSNRGSVASTTKSELRHSNQLLITMLQNIQTELSAHRSIMLDIQQRVSHLEYESSVSIDNDTPQAATLNALEGRQSKRHSKLMPPETTRWWQACQNFAKNSETPFSATEFLKTPRPYSGIEWKYGPQPDTPPESPPKVDDLPGLTPTSEAGDSDVITPRKHDFNFQFDEGGLSTPKVKHTEIEHDIKEHTVEVNKKKMPVPPVLQPPPGGKPIEGDQDKKTKAVAPAAVDNPHRYYKGVKSLATYKAHMKQKATDKEHYVLIHFHNRKDIDHLRDIA